MNYLSPPPIRKPFTDNGGLPYEWLEYAISLTKLFNLSQQTGTTSQRPSPAPFIGFPYFDTTLNKPIWAKTVAVPSVWIDATGATV